MKKYSKAGLLIVTLVIPALIFTFLRFFATNHYNIPYYFPLLDDKGNVRVVGEDTTFYRIEKFKQIGLDGTQLSEHSFDGKLTVLNYLPAACEDSCQVLQNSLERIYSLKSSISSLNLITISDSAADTRKLASSSREGWVVVKVSHADLGDVMNATFRFGTRVPKAKTNSVESKLILIDTEKHIRGYYNGYDPEEINRLMAEIKILNFEEKESSSK